MDEDSKALKEGEENSEVESPTPEQTPGDIVEPAVATVDETIETDGESKKGAQARIRELDQKAKVADQKAKVAEEKAKSLEEKLAELTGSVEPQQQTPSYTQNRYDQTPFNPQEPIVADGEEISVAELNRRITERDQRLLQQADARSELRARQSEAINRINNEAGDVIKNYPELDPENEHFNRDLSDSITEATEAYVKANPYSASVKKFVARLMKPYKGAVDAEVGKASEQLAKQVSQAALRPTSVSKREKTASEMSLEELEQKLGVVH